MVSKCTRKTPFLSMGKMFTISLLGLYFCKGLFLMFSDYPLFPQDTKGNYFTSMLPGKASRKLFVSFSSSFVPTRIYLIQLGGQGPLRSVCMQLYN